MFIIGYDLRVCAGVTLCDTFCGAHKGGVLEYHTYLSDQDSYVDYP